MNPDGPGIYLLANAGAIDGAPFWNAVGSQIVLQTNRDGNDEIYQMTSDGSFQTDLTTNGTADGAPDLEH